MLERYFYDVERSEAEKLINESKTPFIIRRTSSENDKNIKIFYSARGKEQDEKEGKAYWYAISFKGVTQKGERVCHLKFKSYETDPEELNEKLYYWCLEQLKGYKVKVVLDNSPPISESRCELISIHRNAELRPEEMIKASNMFNNSGVLILSTQTPEKELKQGVQAGKTGIEMKKILSEAKLDEPWVIITGHGSIGADEIAGVYKMFGAASSPASIDVEMTPKQYMQMLIQGGLKEGDHINIILNVCYGGAREEKEGSTVKYTSFAEKLAWELIEQDISAFIVASKTPIQRFSGEYFEGEIPGKCMLFRAEGGPESFRFVYSGLDSAGKKSVGMRKNFKEPFIISSVGIDFQSKLQEKLTVLQESEKAKSKQSPPS